MMKRKLLALALSCLMCLALVGPARAAVEEIADLRVDDVTAYSPDVGIYTVVERGLYGFCAADGSILAEPAYVAVGEFSEGMAAVSLAGEWTTVHDGGEPVRVLQGGRFGYVNADCAVTVPMRYSRAFPFSEGRAFAVSAETGRLVLLDQLGQELASYPWAEVMENESIQFSEGLAVIPTRRGGALVYMVVDLAGREVCVLTDVYVDFTNGYHSGRVAVSSEGEWITGPSGLTRRFEAVPDSWGYRDVKGEAAGGGFAAAQSFSEGLAAVGLRSERGDVLYGFIDPEGAFIVPAEYDEVRPYENGLAALRRGGRWAFVDQTGRTTTGFAYDETGRFAEGVALVRSDGRLRAVDERGWTLFTCEEAVSGEPFSGGVTVVRRADGLWGVCDREGNMLTAFDYENARHWDGFLWLKRGDLWRVYRTEDVIDANRAAPEGVTAPVGAFIDVPQDSWYAAAVTWATDHDVITGTGGGQFSPDKPCTVGEIITFLWRALGRPAPEVENPFTDVFPTNYYYQAALWACQSGLVEDGEFGAAQLCTRSMAVTYLWRLAGGPFSMAALFSDVPLDAPYAQAVSWAVEEGITAGSGDGLFSPEGICSRGQIVTFLHRYLTE